MHNVQRARRKRKSNLDGCQMLDVRKTSLQDAQETILFELPV